jgi:GT2 family glycosyltransferase
MHPGEGLIDVDLSFLILTWNSKSYIQACLASIENALAGGALTYEILVLDNGSSDGTPELLARLAAESGGRLIPHYETTNTGTTRSRNRLIRAASGRYLCVMDSDVEIRPGVLETLVPMLTADPTIGIVVPRILYPSGRWQKSFDRFPTIIDKANRFLRLRAIEAREATQSESFQQRAVDYAISAFWLMRREVSARVGHLDERIFYAPEDVDFCLRVWKAGLTILYVPSVSVVHHTQELSRGFKINRAKIAHLKGLAYYFCKHRYLLNRPRFQ